MGENRIMQQISSIFSVFMVFFYVGIGSFFIFFFEQSYLDKAVLIIIGSTFLLYGIYRAFRAYFQIKETFFNNSND